MADLICSTDVSNLLRSSTAKEARDAISASSSEIVTVANDAARFALTVNNVSENSIVYVTSDDRYYVVVNIENITTNEGWGDIGYAGVNKVIVRNGLSDSLNEIILEEGELGYTTDTKKLYIGDGSALGGNLAGVNSQDGNAIISEYNIADGYGRFVTNTTFSYLSFSLKSSTGYVAVQWWDGTVSIYGNGDPQNLSYPLSPSSTASSLRSVLFWSCTSDTNATKSGDITYLSVQFINLVSLDVSKLTELTELNLEFSELTSLDVSNNVALTQLNCSINRLTSLDVSNNVALTQLFCENNQLTSLDVSNNVVLTNLWCGANELTSLDVSNNVALTELYCYDNNLTSLDVSNNVALFGLNCENNQLTYLNISNITSDGYVTHYCGNNPQLSNIDANNLLCVDNSYLYLDLTNCNIDTDSLYNTLSQFAIQTGVCYVSLDGNPCDGGSELLRGDIHSVNDVLQLIDDNNINLILT